MSLQIDGHEFLIGGRVKEPHFETKNLFSGWRIPRYIISHYTGGGVGKYSLESLAEKDLAYHVLIDRDGSFYQCGKFNKVSSHSGLSNWKGRHGMNQLGIGVSMACYGSSAKKYNKEGVEAVHKNNAEGKAKIFEPFTEEQIQTYKEICSALCEEYPSIRNIIGHDDVSVGRRDDPGPFLESAIEELRTDLSAAGKLKLEKERKSFKARVVAEPGDDDAAVYYDYNRANVKTRLEKGTQLSVLSQVYKSKGDSYVLIDRYSVSIDGISLYGFMSGKNLSL
ncbi:MAG: N-acetylmuramoyl-L-alanine amidase [Verrucomicrobiota bacterium]